MKRRYRILFPHPVGSKLRTKESDNITHWIVSMNGQDHVAVKLDGKRVRGFFRVPEFKPNYNLL